MYATQRKIEKTFCNCRKKNLMVKRTEG